MTTFFWRLCGSNKQKTKYNDKAKFLSPKQTAEPQYTQSDSSPSIGQDQYEILADKDMLNVRGTSYRNRPAVKDPGFDYEILSDYDVKFIDELNILYKEDRIFEAYDMMQEWIMEEGEDVVQQYPIWQEIEAEYKDAMACLQIINDNESWTTHSSSNKQVSIKYKLASAQAVTIKIEGVMDAPIVNIFSLIYETDLYSSWQALVKSSDLIHNISKTKRIIQNLWNIPVPFVKNRDNILYCTAVNALNTPHKSFMGIGRSVKGSTFKGISIPDPKKNVVRSEVRIVGATVTPLEDGKTFFRFVSNFEPKIKAIPNSLANWFSRKFSKWLFKKVQKKSRDMARTEHERRQNDPKTGKFYDYIRETLGQVAN